MTQPADPFQIFSRACTVTVGTLQISDFGLQTGLDVWFQTKRSLKAGTPNTCDLKLYNLTPPQRAQITGNGTPSAMTPSASSAAPIVPVQIQAGYVGNTSLVFAGQLRSAQTVKEGPDYVTELSTGDGDAAVIISRTSTAFGPGSNAWLVAQKLVADMSQQLGVNVAGNIAKVSTILKASPCYAQGTVLKGSSYSLLQDLATSCGLEVSFQAGSLQWTTSGQPLGGQAYSLSSSTGLYESPSLDTKGVLNCKTAMLPGIAPGVSIALNALFVQGIFRITSVETTGDTRGKEWEHKIEAKKFGLSGG